jgi:predicted aspartyl protease
MSCAPRLALIGSMLLPALSASAEPIRLPVTLVGSNPVTTITVGDRPVQAIVDTGGGGAVTLSKDLIDSVGGVKLPESRVSNDAFGRESVNYLYRIPRITIGGHHFNDLTVLQALDHPAGSGPAVPSAIGRELLAKYFVVVDYAGGSITLWPPESRNANCGRVVLRMHSAENDARLATGEFELQAGRVRLLFDTGAQYSILSETVADSLRLATIARGQTRFYQADKFSAAGQALDPLEFVILPATPPAGAQGFLGVNFFAQNVVCLDYRRKEIRIKRSDAAQPR